MNKPKSSVGRYGIGLLATAVALALSVSFRSFLGDSSPYLLLYVAVVFSAWSCGLTPSILTAISGALGVWFLFLSPHKTFVVSSRSDLSGMLGFLIVAVCIVALGEVNRRAQFARLHQANVLDAANDAIIELDPADDTIKYWNHGAEKLYGWTRSEAMGKNINSLLKTAAAQPLDQSKAAVLRHGNWEGELIHARRDGAQVYVASRSALKKETERKPAIWLQIDRDITERKKAEQELQRAEDARRAARELAYRELEKQVQERTAELEQSNQQLRQLSASLIRSQDDERRRIARELHDSAGQYLGAVSIALDVAKSEQDSATRKMEEAASMAKACASEIRTISHLLHPPLLEELGLASAAHWYVDGFAARSGIHVEVNIPEQLERLGNEVELVLFRILQECLTNIHRHSGSKTATVQIGADPKQVWLEVRDQGRGSGDGASEFRPGIGITGMRERVKDLAGTLEISTGRSGTRVRAVLPLAGGQSQPKANLNTSAAAG